MAIRNGTTGADRLWGTAESDQIQGFDPAAQSGGSVTRFDELAPSFVLPVGAVGVPGQPGRLVVIEKGGTARVLDTQAETVQATPFLDLEVSTAGEQGLLGLAFHPAFETNRLVYVAASTPGSGGQDVAIRSFRVGPGSELAVEPGSARTLLTIDYPANQTNHRAGWIEFGPDGALYIATGDGGGSGDPLGNAQDRSSLLGKILRIDVNGDAFPNDAARNYRILADNPFAGVADGRDEIWASGLRNPFRNVFDPATGQLWIADVGQNRREEINLGVAGANYGWDRFEGTLPFEGTSSAGLTPPVYEYPRADGFSVIGGAVVRGGQDRLQSSFLFGDFGSGDLWALQPDGAGWEARRIADTDRSIVGFTSDARGDLFVVDIAGTVSRIELRAGAVNDAADTIRAGGGADQVWAGMGDDLVQGDGGADRIQGQAGNDLLAGGRGADRLWGGDGNDRLEGGAGADRLDGAAGYDRAFYQASAAGVSVDLATGAGAGGDAQGDRLTAVEWLRGSAQRDLLVGDARANRLEGIAGDDALRGGAGFDALAGGAGDDRLDGGAGNDTLQGGRGFDVLRGGAGADRFVVATLLESVPGRPDRVLDFQQGQGDRIDLSAIDTGAAAGDQGFVFVGASSFTGGGTASARAMDYANGVRLLADLGDGVADLAILLAGVDTLSGGALLL